MISKTITYRNFEDKEVTEKFHFNLTKAELLELELGAEGGMAALAQKIQETKNAKEMIGLFKTLILKAYGEFMTLPNGKSQFIKDPVMSNAFAQTDAYSELFIELAGDDKKATEFIMGIIPSNMAGEVAKEMAKQNTPVAAIEAAAE